MSHSFSPGPALAVAKPSLNGGPVSLSEIVSLLLIPPGSVGVDTLMSAAARVGFTHLGERWPAVSRSREVSDAPIEQVAAELVRRSTRSEGPTGLGAVLLRDRERVGLLLTCFRDRLDATSLDLLADDIIREVEGEPVPRRPLTQGTVASDDDARVLSERLEKTRRELAGGTSVLDLPLRGERTAKVAGTRAVHRWPGTLPEPARGPYAERLSAFAVLLQRYTGQHDMTLELSVDRRKEPATLGSHTDRAPMRMRIAPRATALTLIEQVERDVDDLVEGPQLPPEDLAALFGREDDDLELRVLFECTPGLTPRMGWEAVPIKAGAVEGDIEVLVHGNTCHFHYNGDLMHPTVVERMADSYVRLLEELSRPDRPVEELSALGPSQVELLRSWSLTPDIVSEHAPPVHELIEHWATRTPEHPAVEAEDTVSYAEYNERANRLAAELAERGVTQGGCVAVCLDRSVKLLTAMTAVHKTGAAALLLDVHAPDPFLRDLIERGRPSLLISQETIGRANDLMPGRTVLLDRDAEALRRHGAFDRGVGVCPDDIAYFVQTSGSSGHPKLVAVPHRTLTHAALTQRELHGIEPGVRGAWTFPPHTNVSANVVVWPFLTSGGTLCLPPEGTVTDVPALRDWLVARNITQCFCVSPLAEQLVSLDWPEGCALQFLLTGSDRVRGWAEAGLPFEVGNWYGTNEVNIVASSIIPWEERLTSWTASAEDRSGPPPIGRVWPGVRAYVVDGSLRLAPPGALGELLIGGAELSHGYLDTAQTAASYVPDPFGDSPGGRLYRTGDLVRYRHDGLLIYCGRVDQQVKIRGMRVEVAEVERVLLDHPDVTGVVVSAVTADGGDPRLVGYVVAGPGATAVRLREYIAGRLPEHMVPNDFAFVDEFSRNAGGKLDRARLPEIDWQHGRGDDDRSHAPHGELEAMIVDVWAEVLGGEADVDSNFFLLGGDSLMAARVSRLLLGRTGTEVTLKQILLAPTPRELAEVFRK